MNVSIQMNRVVAVLIVALAFAAYIYHDESKWSALGRDAFLSHQATRFDQHISHPNMAALIIGCPIVIGLLFAAYELLAFLLAKIFSPSRSTSAAQ